MSKERTKLTKIYLESPNIEFIGTYISPSKATCRKCKKTIPPNKKKYIISESDGRHYKERHYHIRCVSKAWIRGQINKVINQKEESVAVLKHKIKYLKTSLAEL